MTWACDPALTSTIVGSYSAAGPLFVNTLQSFLAAHCALVGDHVWPADVTNSVIQDPNYDFIVVGAGSAGSVVANRLSEIPNWKVLLVEAGGNPTFGTETPQIFYSNLNTTEDWGYKTTPQDGACRGYKSKGCAWPRGKVLGGCSSINAMFYIRGNKKDYDEWAAEGNEGWSYEDVLPYFKKSENFYLPLTKETEKFHGTGGYMHVEHTKNVYDIEKFILKANEELGTKILQDVTGYNQMGVTRSLTTTKEGVRHSTARAFLSPIKDRPNLHVMKNAHVTKILFKENSNEVRGVLINKDGKDIIVNAKKEVIISGGAINTPQLLMLSGIGPKEHLKEHGIEVKVDLPVGKNLEDHAFVPMFYTTESHEDNVNVANVVGSFAEFLLEHKGIFSDLSPHRITGFINTEDTKASFPDIQNHYLVFTPNQTKVLNYFGVHGLSDEIDDQFKEINKQNAVLIPYSVLLKPKSKGEILLKSRNPFDYPLIYANYFENQDDLRTIIKGMKYIAKLGDTETFKSLGFKLHWLDIEACRGYAKDSDDIYECMAREITFSLYHPVSTARMGPDSDTNAVVDTELKVRGIKKLRVIDGSIMPSIVRGNTNAPVIMIGEKGSDLIKKDWLKEHTEL